MNQDAARSILKLIAVVTVLVGLVLTSTTLQILYGVKSVMQSAPQGMQIQATGLVGEMGTYTVLAYASIVVWGVVLYLTSYFLARQVAS